MRVQSVSFICWLSLLPAVVGRCASAPRLHEYVNKSLKPGCKAMEDIKAPEWGRRYFSSNHKTGTMLFGCLSKQFKRKMGIKIECLSKHMSHGFSDHSFQVNFVRNPFYIVSSGYRYHRQAPEKWTCTLWADMGPERSTEGHWQGAKAAMDSWSRWCNTGGTKIYRNMSYSSALASLTKSEGLLLESLRALYRDIPYVLRSAHDCFKVKTTEHGACANVILDNFSADINSTMLGVISEALNLSALRDFSKNALLSVGSSCDPTRLIAMRGSPAERHVTFHMTNPIEREREIEHIRYLDKKYLGEQLRLAEAELYSYMRNN